MALRHADYNSQILPPVHAQVPVQTHGAPPPPPPPRTPSTAVRSFSVQPDLPPRSSRYLSDSGAAARPPSHAAETIRRPLIYFAKFGAGGSWSLDVFTLPHNAVRAECVDLYNILESIHARSRQVCVLELEEFFVWWTAFEMFVIEYFDFEADVLLPWVFPHRVKAAVAAPNVSAEEVARAAGYVPMPVPTATHMSWPQQQQHSPQSPPPPLQQEPQQQAMRRHQLQSAPPRDVPKAAALNVMLRNSLLERKEALLDSIRQLNGTFELRRHVDTSDVFQTILEEVNEFVPKLLEYFHTQERHLPGIAASLYTSASRDAIFRKYLQYVRRGEAPQTNVVLLSRWMDGEARDKWVRGHVRGYCRLMHRRWERRCHRAHGGIAYKFHKRLERSVRSVAASRLRRRTEFGEEVDDLSFGSFASQGDGGGGGSVRSLSVAVGARAAARNALEEQRSDDFGRATAAAVAKSLFASAGSERGGVGDG